MQSALGMPMCVVSLGQTRGFDGQVQNFFGWQSFNREGLLF